MKTSLYYAVLNRKSGVLSQQGAEEFGALLHSWANAIASLLTDREVVDWVPSMLKKAVQEHPGWEYPPHAEREGMKLAQERISIIHRQIEQLVTSLIDKQAQTRGPDPRI